MRRLTKLKHKAKKQLLSNGSVNGRSKTYIWSEKQNDQLTGGVFWYEEIILNPAIMEQEKQNNMFKVHENIFF